MEYRKLVCELDDHIGSILERQITDTAHHHCGGFVDADRLAGTQGVSAVASLGYAYLLSESRHHRSAELLERILLAADFARRLRRPSGCFDLLSTNFDSAPDTAFTVGAIGPVVVEARRHTDDEGSRAIAEALGELVQTAAPGMMAGGFHTPNHRWVLVAALVQAQMLYPELEVLPVVEAYLGEGIDINADGEYIERSTGTYNAIVNRALIRIAQVLTRPELLEPVRRNLDLSFHLLHADATVVTSISKRQDRGTRVVPRGLADGYHAMAHIDGSGFYAGVAAWLTAAGGGLVCLPNYILNPQWRGESVYPEPLPPSYNRVYPVSGLWRVRREQVSATAAAGLTAPFSAVSGAAELTAVKASSTFFATGQFVGEDFAATDTGVRMRHRGRNSIYPEHDYKGGDLLVADLRGGRCRQLARGTGQARDLRPAASGGGAGDCSGGGRLRPALAHDGGRRRGALSDRVRLRSRRDFRNRDRPSRGDGGPDGFSQIGLRTLSRRCGCHTHRPRGFCPRDVEDAQ